jgi:hypothetical protein
MHCVRFQEAWKNRDKEARRFLSLTDEALHNHLSGMITIGVYPLLLDEKCWFLTVECDQQMWRQDATEFVESCRNLERSSGAGAVSLW